MAPPPSRRLLIFQEARNPQNTAEVVYLPVNKLGLPICGPGPELPSILELPLRILKAFTDIFNQPKYKGWSIMGAGPYHDTSEEGKYYACRYAGKFFLIDFAKTSGGYEPIGFPLQLSEASHILKMVLTGEGRPSSSSPLSDEVIFFEDSVLMQTIASIISFATKSYAYVKSYNDTKHKGYHAIVVATDGPHICANPIQPLCVHNPQGPVLTYSEDPSNEYLKDLTEACERYNVHILLLSTNIFDGQAFDSSFFDQPVSMLALPCKENTNNQTAKTPMPSIGPSASPFITPASFSAPQNNQATVKPENNEITVTLRDILLHTPGQSPKDGSPHPTG
ncbi:hypothetical protein BDV32DRAFT_142312 [Aspergillus pseudonomiae]|uniref:Uncharacterized protein n=1 Tax=Aspergillus pseudonomiae TaxID=1506151 RepID=A0A5N6HN30_9EURO|nr:uncharacterized protein BDV37DRAFT_275852 [Aspergillus pseudonomiae]KAB8255109.1 hypothetical protein BDV32DRAFT_142312 [Aspergillus pseudonomiae]KAE8398756.1 hypothetical protein BDV37DRAFT_275852 [Aspergillus pseudonomiae]